MTARELDALLAESQINKLQARYAHLCDVGFPPRAISALFASDGVWQSGPEGVRCVGADQIERHFEAASQDYPWSLHVNVPLGVDVAADGRSARGAWHLLMPCVDASGERETAAWLAGRYDNTFIKVGDEWKYQHLSIRFGLMAPHLGDWATNRMPLGRVARTQHSEALPFPVPPGGHLSPKPADRTERRTP